MGHCMSTPSTEVTGAKYEKKSVRGDDSGKMRFIGEKFGITGSAVDDQGQRYNLIVFISADDLICFTVVHEVTMSLWTAQLSDDQITRLRGSQSITLSSPVMFKNLASEVIKGKGKILAPTGRKQTEVTLVVSLSKDLKVVQTLSVQCQRQPGADGLLTMFTKPMIQIIQHKRRDSLSSGEDKETTACRLQARTIAVQGSMLFSRTYIETHKPLLTPLREEAAATSKTTSESMCRLQRAERKLRTLTNASDDRKPLLDVIYSRGGAVPFPHCEDAEEHVPVEQSSPNAVLDYVKRMLPLKHTELQMTSVLSTCPVDPHLAQLYQGLQEHGDHAALDVLSNIDKWDYNVFEADRSTGNNALFYTTYTILYKLNLVNHFNIDDQVLRNFLGALQSGYHPNPYHNATHAADVTQINYFIITTGGLAERCQLSKEDLLGAMIAGAIHDYDHPGFNNNFHTRTNAYLSTLYNDRSILENHHCACVSEILKLPKYNIFASLTDDQRRAARETMLEMVLATDMGNHAKIFSSFKRRVAEGAKWYDRREDLHLALSMSIKMADISNCGRPKHLYLEWAKNIATEFYNQGDAEERRGLPISPFMDRRKDKTDFPKGQTSFMGFVVVPMFEAVAEFLPPVEVALQHCHENKEYWLNQP